MAESSSEASEGAVHALRFGAFEMDIKSGELRRNGALVRLQPQPFKVLALLADQPGEVVTREEIQSKVWAAGTFVDFEQSLNFCIRQIRSALGDSAVRPRFVETLPRRGYRWVGGSVERVPSSATVHEWPRPVSEDKSNRIGSAGVGTLPSDAELDPRWSTVALVLAGAIIFMSALAFAYRLGGRPERAVPSPTFQRITFHRGAVTSARFGPENQVVYVASWEGRRSDMQLVNSGARESRPLDIANARIVAASDTEVAFLKNRVLARAPLAGGPHREISRGIEAADWTANAAEFAVVRADGRRFRLEYPIGRSLGEVQDVTRLRLSPDGQLLALAEHPMFGDDRGQVVILDRDGERLAVSGPWGSLEGLAWSPRGDEVWFTAARIGVKSELYALSRDGQVRHIYAAMGRLVLHDVAPDGRVLLERTGIGSETFFGRSQAELRDLSWLDFSGVESLSADGSTALLVESGDGAGPDYTTYLRPTDGSLPMKLGSGRGTSLSADGKWALMIPVRTPDHVRLVPTGAGKSRRLQVPGNARHEIAGWLPDGESLYVSTRDESGRWQTWLVDAASLKPRPLPLPEGVVLYANTFSPDGSRFVTLCPDSDLHCVYSTSGSDPVPLATAEPEWRAVAWDKDDKVYFRDRVAGLPETLWRVAVATGQRERVADLAPPDRSGVLGLSRVTVAHSGEAWTFSLIRRLSDIYVVTNLH